MDGLNVDVLFTCSICRFRHQQPRVRELGHRRQAQPVTTRQCPTFHDQIWPRRFERKVAEEKLKS
jgi:hypothetical protein